MDSATYDRPLDSIPEEIAAAKGIAVRTSIPRDDVLEQGADLMPYAFACVAALWPVYRFLIASDTEITTVLR